MTNEVSESRRDTCESLKATFGLLGLYSLSTTRKVLPPSRYLLDTYFCPEGAKEQSSSLTEALAAEIAPFGLHTVIVEPGL